MISEIFFKKKSSVDLRKFFKKSNIDFLCSCKQDLIVQGVSSFAHAQKGDLIFLEHPRYLVALKNTNAGFCLVSEGVCFDEYAVIEDDVDIGSHSDICPHVISRKCVTIGKNSKIDSHAHLGQEVFIYPGVRIGQNGFAFVKHKDRYVSIPQLGRVIIGDRVEIRANTTIDRGTLDDTIIGSDVNLDNAVHVGHNVHLQEGAW